MNILENIFLVLTIAIPSFFLFLGISEFKRLRRNKKFRKRLIMFMLVSLCFNGAIYGGIRMYNARQSEPGEKNSNKVGNDTSKIDNPNTEPNAEPDVNKTSKGFKIETKDGVTYVDGYLLVNKTYPLPENYVPTGTYKEVTSENCQECIINDAYTAYKTMREDAAKENLSLWITSGYRSYKYQGGLYNMYVNRSGKEAADTFSARPGHSEHQSGYAFDLNSVTDAFASTKEGKWVADNCQKYGFIIRYPKGKETETGYKYESWHLRYVGTELATILYNGGDWITMEDYFGLTSEYQS